MTTERKKVASTMPHDWRGTSLLAALNHPSRGFNRAKIARALIARIINSGSYSIEEFNSYGKMLLQHAIANGDVELVTYLVSDFKMTPEQLSTTHPMKCALIDIQEYPKDDPKKSPFTARELNEKWRSIREGLSVNQAFVRQRSPDSDKNSLFYINDADGLCVKIELTLEQLALFDTEIQPTAWKQIPYSMGKHNVLDEIRKAKHGVL